VETITAYLERLELYFDANSVLARKIVSVLLYGIKPKVYWVLRSVLALTRPQDKTFIEIITMLKAQYDPNALVIAKPVQY